jgi:hypothetical protein
MWFVSGLAVIGLAAIAVSTGMAEALAASPAYCALYAREYAQQFIEPATPASSATQQVQDQAYYRCLNLDENPEFPATSAYFGADADDLLAGDLLTAVSQGDISEDDLDTAAPADADVAQTASTATTRRRPGRGSGYDPWTPEWVAWCEAHYRSFDPDTGYVKTYAGVRKLCP